jgi:hypothetical protein
MFRPIASFPLAAALLLTAAPAQDPTRRGLPDPIDLPAAFLRAVERGTRTLTGTPGPQHWTNRAAYALALELDAEHRRVTGRAQMTYENRSPDPLQHLVVHLRQNLSAPGMPRNTEVVPTRGFELAAVTAKGDDTAVRIADRGRAMHPCVVAATWADGRTERRTVPLAHWQGATAAELVFPGQPVKIELDPDLTSLDVERGNNTWERR